MKNLILFVGLSISLNSFSQNTDTKKNTPVLYTVSPNSDEKIKLVNQEIEKLNFQLISEKNNAELFNQRGMFYFALNDYNNAIIDFDKAIELIPEQSKSYFYRGLAKNMTKKTFKISGCQDIKKSKQLGFSECDWNSLSIMCHDL
ncbi:tetratricopeptide repeat protein [Flavobacterium enshiense]|uniref:tetratricopeptide repeat protein n=1 Tax=Flavobacterium enshiense TaxID=1341165 RepID=UPI00345E02D6